MGKTWTSEIERAWLMARMPDFLQAQADSNIPSFKVKVTSEWTKAFPIMGMDDDTLSSEARQRIAEQMQAQHTVCYKLFMFGFESVTLSAEGGPVVLQRKRLPQAKN